MNGGVSVSAENVQSGSSGSVGIFGNAGAFGLSGGGSINVGSGSLGGAKGFLGVGKGANIGVQFCQSDISC